MNANEVIANLALESLGHSKGEYQHVSPNDHVNFGQSTNDIYPTAFRLALILRLDELHDGAAPAAGGLLRQGHGVRARAEDGPHPSAGRRADVARRRNSAAGAPPSARRSSASPRRARCCARSISAPPRSAPPSPRRPAIPSSRYGICALTGVDFILAGDLVEATSDTGAYVLLSGVLKRTASKLTKICNDIRLLASGPRAGFNEINLPQMQPGSSIMPGKVNP